jgi:methionyl aminopeptidase
MQKEIMDKYILAGKIASEVREESKSLIKVGANLLDIAEKIEANIKKKGALPAFPANLSLNDAAAHYTPTKNDETKISDGDVIKVDIGVHVDGYIGDTAYTISFDKKYDKMVRASESALEEAIKLCRPGALLNDVSAKIEETIKSFGYKPVSNLTGHGLERFNLHAEPSVPNVKFSGDYRLRDGQVIAIEPFATDGFGEIKESEQSLIFMLLQDKPTRNQDARAIVKFAEQFMHDGHSLPFAERWIPMDSLFRIRVALRELKQREAIYDYPVLKEVKKGIITQAEHTIIVRDEPIITTLDLK